MRPELDDRGLQIVTLCTDTPEQIRKGRGKHGLDAVMLSDREAKIARMFGVENTNPAIKPPGVTALPIPTTFLIDALGIVRWIDQSDDYAVRSEPDRVMAAIAKAIPV